MLDLMKTSQFFNFPGCKQQCGDGFFYLYISHVTVVKAFSSGCFSIVNRYKELPASTDSLVSYFYAVTSEVSVIARTFHVVS